MDLKKANAFNLLLNTRKLNVCVDEVLKEIISHSDGKWSKKRKEARVNELMIERFSKAQQMQVNLKLQAWFTLYYVMQFYLGRRYVLFLFSYEKGVLIL